MAVTVTLVNPVSSDYAQKVGLSARDYAIGESVSVEEWVAATWVRTGYAYISVAAPAALTAGTGPPDAGLGAQGSYYLDTYAQRLYGPKNASGWPVALSPGRGITTAAVSGGRLVLTFSDGGTLDVGNVQGPAGGGSTDTRLDGLTAAATPNVVVLRDSAARFKAADPAVAGDVATKGYVDTADLTFRRILTVAVSASRALTIDDEGDQLIVDSTSAITVTVPPNSSVAFPVGSWVDVVRANTGTVTIAPGSGVTLVAPDGNYTVRARYSTLRLRKTATDTWYVEGDNTSATDTLVAAATSAATVSAIMRRDASGRAQVVDPSASADVATKNYVDTRDALYVPLTQRGAASGVATLGTDGVIPSAQLPPLAITDTFVVNTQAQMLALTAQVGDVAVRTDGTGSFILRLSDSTALASWQQLTAPTDAVISVDGLTGAVALGDVAASASSLARRQSTGALTVGTPSATTDAVTKAYADALGVSTATASTIARRDSAGRLAVVAAAASGDATNLTQVQGLADAATTAGRQMPLARTVSAGITLALADAGDVVNVSHTGGSPITVTVPANATVAFPVGTVIDVRVTNTGMVTVAAASGVTILGLSSLTNYLPSGSSALLTKIGTDTWMVLPLNVVQSQNLVQNTGWTAGSPALTLARSGNIATLSGCVTNNNTYSGQVQAVATLPVQYRPLVVPTGTLNFNGNVNVFGEVGIRVTGEIDVVPPGQIGAGTRHLFQMSWGI